MNALTYTETLLLKKLIEKNDTAWASWEDDGAYRQTDFFYVGYINEGKQHRFEVDRQYFTLFEELNWLDWSPY